MSTVDVPVEVQRQVLMIQKVRKTVEVQQVQPTDRVVGVTVVLQHQVPTSQTVQRTVNVSADSGLPTERGNVARIRLWSIWPQSAFGSRCDGSASPLNMSIADVLEWTEVSAATGEVVDVR